MAAEAISKGGTGGMLTTNIPHIRLLIFYGTHR